MASEDRGVNRGARHAHAHARPRPRLRARPRPRSPSPALALSRTRARADARAHAMPAPLRSAGDASPRVGQIRRMSDDEDLFELAMDTLGTKRGARAAARPMKPRPEGVTVTEDVDFEAVMRSSKGPAMDLAKVAPVKQVPGASDAAQAGDGMPEVPKPLDRSRYVASEREAQEFAEAMLGLGSPPVDRREAATTTRANPATEDLARRLKRGEIESDAVLDLHGSTQRVARSKLADFIKEAHVEGWEIVTIIVGRGLRSDRGEAVLRPLVERWLVEEHRSEVREVHAAPAYMGGSGAWVAAIRKGSAKI